MDYFNLIANKKNNLPKNASFRNWPPKPKGVEEWRQDLPESNSWAVRADPYRDHMMSIMRDPPTACSGQGEDEEEWVDGQ